MAVSGVIPQLRTTNLDESIDFYVGKLGLELAWGTREFFVADNQGHVVCFGQDGAGG